MKFRHVLKWWLYGFQQQTNYGILDHSAHLRALRPDQWGRRLACLLSKALWAWGVTPTVRDSIRREREAQLRRIT